MRALKKKYFNMNIEFTKDEKVSFLKRLGYTHELYIGERDRNMYSSDKEKISFRVDVVFTKENRPKNFDEIDMYHLRDKFGLDYVFHKEITSRFKEFLMKTLS
jgi:hypothetical protein